MKLCDLLDIENLKRHVSAGTIAEVHHPTEPIRLFNYTARCQFANAWDHESRICRGLIIDDEETILARPFPKFHNLHEHGDDTHAGPLSLIPPLRVYEKVDGSLGIAYRRPSDGQIAWATRGSFVSDQAEWANRWWSYYGKELHDGWTWLVEIVYPEARIVLDYKGRSGLVLLAVIGNDTGMQVAPLIPGQFEWPGEVVKLVGYTRDVTSIDRNREPDTEGYVVLGGDYKTRVKLKTDEYMRLHKILTGVSSVTIWDMLRNGDSIDVLYDKVPDEFADWAKATVASLEEAFYEVLSAVADEYMGLAPLLPDRKAFAAEAVKSPYRAILFRTADDKDIVPLIWKMIKPERTLPYLALDESVV